MIMRGNMGKKNGINVHVLMEIKNIIAHLAKNSSDLDRNIVFRLKIDIIIMRGNMGKRNGVNVHILVEIKNVICFHMVKQYAQSTHTYGE